MDDNYDQDEMERMIRDLWETIMKDYMYNNNLGYIFDKMRYDEKHDEKCFREFESFIMENNKVVFEDIDDYYESDSDDDSYNNYT